LVGVYAAAGGIATLWLCAVEVPMAYARHQRGIITNLAAHARSWIDNMQQAPFNFVPLTLLVASGVFSFLRSLLLSLKADSTESTDEFLIIALMFCATLGSVLTSGAAYPHYWNQLLPFAAIVVSLGIAACRARRAAFGAHVILVLVACGSAIAATAPSTLHVVANWTETQNAYSIRRAAALIAADKRAEDKIWALENHLVLWYLNQPPISPAATHPDNLVREPIIDTLTRGGYVPPREFERVLASEPRYIVTGSPQAPWYLKGNEAAQFQRLLSDKYELWHRIESVSIYRRKAG
jgi:hypothetical protein